MAIRFFFNGLKIDKGPLTKARVTYNDGTNFRPEREPHVEVYGDSYCTNFPPEVTAAGFEIIDNTDSQSDYFEKERFQVYHTHPMFPAALAAAKKGVLRDVKRLEKTGRYPQWLTEARAKLVEIEAVEANGVSTPTPEPTPNNVVQLRLVDPRAEAVQAVVEADEAPKPDPAYAAKILDEDEANEWTIPEEVIEEIRNNASPLYVPVKVVIHWSEADNALKGAIFDSLVEANDALKVVCDDLRPTHKPGTYYKTKFSLFVGADEYEGRIDLLDGGPETLDGHIRAHLDSVSGRGLTADAYVMKWRSLLALTMAVGMLGTASLMEDLVVAKTENAELKAPRHSH